MAGLVVRIVLGAYKSFKTARMSKAVSAEVASAGLSVGAMSAADLSNLGLQEAHDDDFTPEEEKEAIDTNVTMAWCQLAISTLQLSLCSYRFKDDPLENGVTIAFVSVSIPLAFMGLSALNHPESAHAVGTMQIYQWYFILRVLVTCWDYSFEVRKRDSSSRPRAHLIIATGVMTAIVVLQILNSLLVIAVIRILRKRRRVAEARDASEAGSSRGSETGRKSTVPDEKTPLVGGGGGGGGRHQGEGAEGWRGGDAEEGGISGEEPRKGLQKRR